MPLNLLIANMMPLKDCQTVPHHLFLFGLVLVQFCPLFFSSSNTVWRGCYQMSQKAK